MTAERLREKARYGWFDAGLRALREETDAALEAGADVPEEPGGWWHQYVCPAHGAELRFDPREREAFAFRCPHGCILEDEAYRGAWLVFKHQERARTALSAAAIYAATGEAKYAEAANAILEAYASQYPRYPVHPDAQPWMLKGRAFHQALTEAIWATTILRAYLLLRDAGALKVDASAADAFFAMLEGSMAEYRRILIEERDEPANNYTAWLNACLACLFAARDDRAGMEALVSARGGLRHHLEIGVLPDQLEFEGSLYYHVFVLRAYWIAAEMAERLGFDTTAWTGSGGQSFRGMLEAIVGLAAPNGELPALHDGPYSRPPYAREIAEVFELGYARYGDARYAPILREAYRRADGDGGAGSPERRGLEAVLYGEGEWPATEPLSEPSRLYASAGFAALRHPDNPLSLLADFGPHGGSHGHDDKLNVVLMHRNGFVLPERGMVPYGSELRKRWFARTPSHNTVSVGGRTQAAHTGACLRFDAAAHRSYAWLRSAGAYAGATLDRHLWVDRDVALDWFEVRLDQEETIDYWLHFAEPLDTAGGWAACPPDAAPGEDEAYGYVATAARWTAEERFAAASTACGGERVTASLLAVPGGELYRIASPGTSVDPSRPLDGLLYRARGRRATFVAAFAAGGSPVRLARGDDGGVLVASAGGGGAAMRFRMTDQGLHRE
ncbi:heparinase II/III family protein [Paenibacillus sp.]|uniref:heparinase II/III domain-containing protein n=1 Tax=Paenibacillus sp. TaxID=58172 RepID=UPI0028126980|nr:heparinase II/III family protein [Paenibacillus sp.]